MKGKEMREYETEITTTDGQMDVFICHPEERAARNYGARSEVEMPTVMLKKNCT